MIGDFKDSWDQSKISPCCSWLSNSLKSSVSGKQNRCCKCGKEW